MTIYRLLARQAELHPDAIALSAPGRPALTYGRLRTRVEQVVATLNALGLGRNDRVAIVLPNGPDMAVAFLGVASGAAAAPLNPTYRAEEFDFYLSDLGAKALIVASGSDSPAVRAAEALRIPIIELSAPPEAEAGGFSLTSNAGDAPRRAQPAGGFAEPDDVALALHTSGTTSRPKLVPLTNANLCA
jgi:acyl-CoA synthetase (AMP-forming)/AMP-acid ligase II